MYSKEKLLEMLSSEKASIRYDACEWIRVSQESSPHIITALKKATYDTDKVVAERAAYALQADVHHQMAIKMGVVEPDKQDQSTNKSALANSKTKGLYNHFPYAQVLAIIFCLLVIFLIRYYSIIKNYMPSIVMIILVAVLIEVVAFPVWLYISRETIKKIIKIQRTQTTLINALPSEGLVEVSGMAGQKNLETPINKSPCVFWQLEVQEFITEEHWSHKGGYSVDTSWKTVYIKTSNEPFEINDDSGYIFIQPEHADIILDNHKYICDLDTQALNTLQKMGIKTTNIDGTKKDLVVYERIISPEKRVHVIGEIQPNKGYKSIVGQMIFDQNEREVVDKLKKELKVKALIVLLITIFCTCTLILSFKFHWRK